MEDKNTAFGENSYELVSQISKDSNLWSKKLNEIVGLTAFSLGLGCLWSEQPEFYGWLCIAFIAVLVFSLRRNFPQKVKMIRQKKIKTEYEEVLAKGIEAHFFSARKTFTETPVFYVGLLFLWFVANGLHAFLVDYAFPFFSK